MKKRVLLSLLALSFAIGSAWSAQIYYVRSTGNDNNPGTSVNTAFLTIEKAISSVQDNDESIIDLEANKIYTVGVLNLGENKKVSIIGSNTTLLAHEKPGKEGGEGGRILRAVQNCNLTLKGLIFKNGRQTEYVLGGGLFFAGNKLMVDSCRFIDNEAGSSGAAIGARGKEVIIRNSYFEGNYTIGGGSVGAAVMQAGQKGVDNCSLLVENCTFYKNDMSLKQTEGGGNGTAIGIYDKTVPSSGGDYTNLAEMKIINCTFLENTSVYPYQGAIDITQSDAIKAYLINNTFLKNDGAIRVGDIFEGEVVMINNLIFAEKAGILGSDNHKVSDMRKPIVGYNNIVIGVERGVNENIDDDCFNGLKADHKNIVEPGSTYPLSKVALATVLSTDLFVPYLAITAPTSEAKDQGLDDSSPYTTINMVPTLDNRSFGKNGIRDIGAFEYDGIAPAPSGIFDLSADVEDFFTISQSQGLVYIANDSPETLHLTIMDLSGRAVYNNSFEESTTVSTQQLGQKGVFLFVLNNNLHHKVKKILIY